MTAMIKANIFTCINTGKALVNGSVISFDKNVKSYKNEDGSYTVDLKILEPLTTESIFTLSIKTDTRHNATVACKKWRELAANIYEYVYSKIIED